MKKTIALLLILIMIPSCFACAPDMPQSAESTSEATSENSTASEETADAPAADTPVQAIVSELFPNAKQINSSTLGKEIVVNGADGPDEAVAAFVKAGYIDYPADKAGEAKFTVNFLVGAKYTAAVYYTAKTRELRIAWEKASKFDISVLEKKPETDTGKLIFAQVGTERVSERDNPLNGMIYVVKLSDGRALIIDGGAENDKNIKNIYSVLEKLGITKDENGRFILAAWIFTHAHGDHIGAATGFINEYWKNVSIEAFLYSFTEDASVIGSSASGIGRLVNDIKAKYPKALQIVPHANMKYYFGNATVSMLYNPELIYSDLEPLSYYNNSSLVFKIGVGESCALIMGDAANDACKVLSRSYSTDIFKSSILQITHHGLYTENKGHTWNFVKQIYNAASPEFAILPMQSKYDGDSRNGRYTVMGSWCDSGFQISYVMNPSDIPQSISGGLSQAHWDEFELFGTVNGEKLATLYGYDGKNTVINAAGLTTYLGATRTTPMITVFEFDTSGVRMTENRELYSWLG